MDKKLQNTILNIINENDGSAYQTLIIDKADKINWADNKPIQSQTITIHQLDLLVKDDLLIKQDLGSNIFLYILTPAGHRIFNSNFKKLWRFVLYDKHNLFVVLSLIISLTSLVISIIVNTK